LAMSLATSACHAKAEAEAPAPTKIVPAGPTPKVEGNHEVVELAEGKYDGDLVIGGNHNVVKGAGYGKTIIKGKLLMSGNHNTVSSVTIEGGGTVEGNHNDATKAEFHGDVTTAKNKNE
jgi:hypothetical protein